MHYFDVVIAGAGPAGTTCAMALAETNLKVAVIDKSGFPRNKVCGDAVAAYVPKVLNSINAEYGKALEAFSVKEIVHTCRIFAPNYKFLDMRSPENGFISTRLDFDNFLYNLVARKQNINWFLNQEITNVTTDQSLQEVTIVTTQNNIKCKLVIGCDGAHSVINKKLTGDQPDLLHYAGGLRGYYLNVKGGAAETYELHFMKDILPGYFWIFPLKNNRSNVGICIPSHVIAKKKINLRKTMEAIIQHDPSIKERFSEAIMDGKLEGYGLPLGSKKKRISGDHFMLCGDAASLIDPATGEGIGQAMISGRYAAWQAIRCFEQNNFSAMFMRQYDREVYKKLWSNARKSYMIQKWVLKKSWFLDLLFNLLLKSRPARRFVFHQVLKVSKT